MDRLKGFGDAASGAVIADVIVDDNVVIDILQLFWGRCQ
jgi:hypothetical protein